MINREPVRDFYRKILGYIDTDSVTGKKTIRNFYMKILGYYDPKDNKTRDFYRRIVGNGDLSSMLIYQDNNKDMN